MEPHSKSPNEEMVIGSCARGYDKPTLDSVRLGADKDIQYSMNLVSVALNEHIRKCKPSKRTDMTPVFFHRLLDLLLSDWNTFFADAHSLKYKKSFQRAYVIQPQMGHLDEESFDVDRHQHDLECLSRIAIVIQRSDVVRKILKLQPCNDFRGSLKVAELREEAMALLSDQQWYFAMTRLSQDIQWNPEEAVLYSRRALCEMYLAKFQLAVEDAEDAVNLDPTRSEFQHVLEEAKRQLRCYDRHETILVPDFYRLGLNHFYGRRGVSRNLSQAKHYLVLAASTGHVEANLFLGKLYIHNHKPQKAYLYLRHAAERGSAEAQYEIGRLLAFGVGCKGDEPSARKWLLQSQKRGFKPKHEGESNWVEEMLQASRNMLKFESNNNLITSGFTVEERLKRFSYWIHFKTEKVQTLVEHAVRFDTKMPEKQLNPELKPAIDRWMPMMVRRAKKGSYQAQCFFTSHHLIIEAKSLFDQNQINASFNKLRKAHRLWKYPIIDISFLVDAAEKILKSDVSDTEASHVLLCSNRIKSLDSRQRLAEHSVKLEPDIPDFHYALSLVYQSMDDYQRAVLAIDRALQLEVHPEWLFTKALLLQMSKANPDHNVTKAYEKFLSCSPHDCRHVPEAHYRLSFLYHSLSNAEKSKSHLNKAVQANNANVRLPCFQPVELSDCVPQSYYQRISKSKFNSVKVGRAQIFELFCSVCRKSNPSMFCFYCQEWVCNPQESLNPGEVLCKATHKAHHKSLVTHSPSGN